MPVFLPLCSLSSVKKGAGSLREFHANQGRAKIGSCVKWPVAAWDRLLPGYWKSAHCASPHGLITGTPAALNGLVSRVATANLLALAMAAIDPSAVPIAMPAARPCHQFGTGLRGGQVERQHASGVQRQHPFFKTIVQRVLAFFCWHRCHTKAQLGDGDRSAPGREYVPVTGRCCKAALPEMPINAKCGFAGKPAPTGGVRARLLGMGR